MRRRVRHRLSNPPAALDIAAGTLVIVICTLVPALGFVVGLSGPLVAIGFTVLPIAGMFAGGWYTAYRSDGGPTAGALAGVLPGLYAGGYIVFLAITADVESQLAEAMNVDPGTQLVPLPVLFGAFGVFIFGYVVGLAALGGFIARYVPVALLWRRLR
ncbi:hypothetical protein ACLI4Z_08210 [Natrialbaceae archaeon A-arb3/5]